MFKVWRFLWILPVFVAVLFFSPSHAEDKGRLPVFVSILPQKYFVERIGGQEVQVSVMVGPGQSPATYEPLPRQMSRLSQAVLYFSIGVPFEDAWLEKIKAASPGMKVINTQKGITLRKMDRYFHHEAQVKRDHTHHHDHQGLDPHIWLDPVLVQEQAKIIHRALVAQRPEKKEYFDSNLREFLTDLEEVDLEINRAFQETSNKRLLVFHPAWGYFCDRYGLTQIPIEIEGKEPGPRELAEIIEFAQEEGIRVVFVQAQFSSGQAKTVAKAIKGRVILIDPLAEDYIANLKSIARAIKEELM